MSGPSTYIPKSGFDKLARSAPAAAAAAHDTMHDLPDAAEPEHLVHLRRHPHLLPRRADRHRHRAGDALCAECGPGLRLRRKHHARRQLRLADALHPFQRRLDVLPRRLYPHVPRPLLRLLQGAARAALDPRRAHLSPDDGHRLLRLCAALGPDVLLGRHRHHQPVHRSTRSPASWARTSPPGCGAISRSATPR